MYVSGFASLAQINWISKRNIFSYWKITKQRKYVLSDQMRRAAISIPSNVAEGNGRSSKVEYKRFVEIARGSQYELQTQLYICVELNYFTESDTEKANELITEVGKMLNNLIKSLS